MADRGGGLGIEDVIITGELDRRPSRAPDHATEAAALMALAEVMSQRPADVLQSLADAIITLTHCDSSGVSLLEPEGGQDVFRWVATAGAWADYRNGTMPRRESPCGKVIERQDVLLMKAPERLFPAVRHASPSISEVLLSPFQIDGVNVGTVWAIKHGAADQFESEDARLLKCLAHFAATAHQMVLALDRAESGRLESDDRLAALRASEARFRQFAELSSDVIWLRDAETMLFDYVSPVFENVYGTDLNTLLPGDNLNHWAKLIHPDDRERAVENLYRVRAGERVTHEFRIQHGTTGEIRWIRDTDFPLTDAQGRVQRVVGTGQDITEQKRAEDALREREERLGLIVENARDYAIFTIDTEGRITDWREGAEAVFGWSRDEAIGRDASLIFTPEDIADGKHLEEMRIAREEGRAPDVRWHVRKDGSRVFMDGALTRLGESTTTGFLKIAQDITERHRAAEALRESEARLLGLVEGIPQLVWRSSDQGLWTWASPQWLDFTGQTQQESHGSGWFDVVHPDDHEAADQAWTRAGPQGQLDVEYRIRRAADGAWLWHHTRSVPVRNAQGRIVEWLGTSTDVQVLKELQEQQGVLVAELQHRTRNLLGVIRSMVDKTARASSDLPDFRTRFRDRLEALARVQGLLSRLNEGDRVTFDELMTSEMAAMNGNADHATLKGPSGVRLRSSTVQTLAMAVHELATNAIKYGALGQPDGRLVVTWSLEPGGAGDRPWLHIDWRESGVIMPPDGVKSTTGGQGRELIERALPYQLSARTTYALGPDGVHCTISIPVSESTVSWEENDV